ncbi:MAG TPA: bifunctional 3-deoxy-7-phosphoheptulonate synthase/chorismate mutase type II [Salinimicrobium sp.]|nr:bifunctional 3-deoxy-7-phosphoheptulonate synthase/chorismate mutase type II [Salinimicrobium sp.]
MENDKALRSWLDDFKLNHPLIIAGPCSAETEEQVLAIAHQLKKTKTTILRAGIWKPRTRPGNFEGVGENGLKWLKRAKEETGLLTATEVANPAHVDLALKYEVDVLWIGARTTVSPFIVQELADALRGVNKIVLVKNPVNPDLALWIGAIERFHTANIKKLGAIHRGFSSYEKLLYRNNPEWQIPIDLQTRFPDLPLFIDPSHIAGDRKLISRLCQTALDLNYDGMMVEVHNNPDEAWSDAEQQITPENFVQMLSDLKRRNKGVNNIASFNELKNLRSKIDLTDDALIDLLAKRMKIAEEIGKVKKEQNVAIFQPERWREIQEKMKLEGSQKGLGEEFILQLCQAIHLESINHQKKVMNQ